MSNLTFDEYQKRAWETAIYPNKGNDFTYPALKLSGESGEVAEKLGKIIRDCNGIVNENHIKEISKELGDVIWYVAALCTTFGLDFGLIAQENLDKLNSRKKRGVLGGSGDNR